VERGRAQVRALVVLSGEIKATKPDPRTFAAVLDALAVRPERTVFADNRPANIDGAFGAKHADSALHHRAGDSRRGLEPFAIVRDTVGDAMDLMLELHSNHLPLVDKWVRAAVRGTGIRNGAVSRPIRAW
jgi:FMN phosphatase YigB (HAD superfamily)